jgi:hypothetical protein
MPGSMAYSKAGYRPYYQIRIDGAQKDPLSRNPFSQSLTVEIEKVRGVVEVRLRKVPA